MATRSWGMPSKYWGIVMLLCLFILVPALTLGLVFGLASDQTTQEVKYLLVFGDSYSTTGSWAGGDAPSTGNPIGNPEFPGQTTSGGINWVGEAISNLNSGPVLAYDFAVSGATTDTAIVGSGAGGVDGQIDLFKQYVADAPLTENNTLTVFWVGINDIGHPYWEDYEAPIPRVMERYAELLNMLYDEGLRRFVLFTIPPFDQAPRMLMEEAEKVEGLRDDIETYNNGVIDILAEFRAAHSDVRAQILNTTSAFVTAMSDPQAYGAPDASCFNGDGVSCLWHDDYHPAIAIHRLIAESLVEAVDFF